MPPPAASAPRCATPTSTSVIRNSGRAPWPTARAAATAWTCVPTHAITMPVFVGKKAGKTVVEIPDPVMDELEPKLD